MKKVITFLLAAVLLLSGCGGSAKQEPMQAPEDAKTPAPAPTEVPTEAPKTSVEVDEGLLTVTITIPAQYLKDRTPADIEADRQTEGFLSVTINEDGSATYVMTKAKHKEILASVESTIREGLEKISNSPDYPGIESIEPGEAFKEFTVRLNTADLGAQETFSVMLLYMYGALYNAYLENGVDNIHVKIINNAGEVIREADSRDMKF